MVSQDSEGRTCLAKGVRISVPQAPVYSKDNEPTQAAHMGGARSAIKLYSSPTSSSSNLAAALQILGSKPSATSVATRAWPADEGVNTGKDLPGKWRLVISLHKEAKWQSVPDA